MAIQIIDLGPGVPLSNSPYAHVHGSSLGTADFVTDPDFTPPANCVIIAGVLGGLPAPETTNEPNYILTDDISPSLEWQKLVANTISFGGDGSFAQVWAAEVGDDPLPMQLRVVHTGLSSHTMTVYVYALLGYNIGDFLRLVAEGSSTSNPFTIDLGGEPLADSEVMAFMSLVGNSGATDVTIGPSAGWTELADNASAGSFVRTQAQHGNEQIVSWAATTAVGTPFNQRLGVAVEIRAESTLIEVTPADATFAGQDIPVNEDPIPVTAVAAVFAGQDITIIDPIVQVDGADAAFAGQNVNVLEGGATLDLASPIYLALADDLFITSRLGSFMSPSIHTRRPVPEGAGYPMIVVNPDTAISDEDGLTSRRPVVVRDIITYGAQDDQYRTVEEIAYYIRQKFHRQKSSLSISGYHVIDIVASGPNPGPTDDWNHVARVVTLTIRLLEL